MANEQRPLLDKVWLVWFALQVVVISCVDALPFYPKSLYATPGSPLHALQLLHDFYVSTYRDLIVLEWHSAEPVRPWVRLFAYFEAAIQFPTAVYGVYRLTGGRRPSGGDELLFLVYAMLTAFTTYVCVHDAYHWDEAMYSMAEKNFLVGAIYGPWALVPTIMFADMYARVLRRVSAGTDAERKNK